MRPAEGSVDADRASPIYVRFSEPLAPRTVHRGTVTLRSGETRIGVSASVDPLLPGIEIAPLGGFVLDPQVEYEVVIEGVRDLDGETAPPFLGVFQTGDAAEGEEELPIVQWPEIEALFAARCVDGCHDATSPLDLSSGEGVQNTAIGVVAAGRTPRAPERGLAGMDIISVLAGQGRPAYSYLLYTLMADPHILGRPMPPDAPLDSEQIALISRWIRQGASTE